MFSSPSSKRILKGYSQVMLQNNKTTGLFFACAIFMGAGVSIFLGSLLGCMVATIFASITNRPIADIENGIYGFNGVLIGMAVTTFYSNWTLTLAGITLGSIASVYILDFFRTKSWKYLTFPFILVTWLLMGLNSIIGFTELKPSILWDMDTVLLNKAILKSYSQVFLVNPTDDFLWLINDYTIVGWLIIVGLLYSMRLSFFYTILGIIACIYLSDLILVPKQYINNGLVGYSVVLCAAYYASKTRAWLYVIASAFLCVLLQWFFFEYSLIALTAPFVFTCWIIDFLEENMISYPKPE